MAVRALHGRYRLLIHLRQVALGGRCFALLDSGILPVGRALNLQGYSALLSRILPRWALRQCSEVSMVVQHYCD